MQDFTDFIRHLKLEALALAVLMVVLTHESGMSLWLLPATFLLFDIGMVGYLVNSKAGAFTYNLTHNLVLPTLCIAGGVFGDWEWLAVLGYIWTFHIAIDRMFGFGLKHKHSFHHTHMGRIKRK